MDRKKQAFLGLAILIVLIIVIVAVTTLKNNVLGKKDFIKHGPYACVSCRS